MKKVILKGDMVIDVKMSSPKATHVMFSVSEYEMMKIDLAKKLEPTDDIQRDWVGRLIQRYFAKYFEKEIKKDENVN